LNKYLKGVLCKQNTFFVIIFPCHYGAIAKKLSAKSLPLTSVNGILMNLLALAENGFIIREQIIWLKPKKWLNYLVPLTEVNGNESLFIFRQILTQ